MQMMSVKQASRDKISNIKKLHEKYQIFKKKLYEVMKFSRKNNKHLNINL